MKKTLSFLTLLMSISNNNFGTHKQWISLYLAALNGLAEQAQLLLKDGAQVDVRDKAGRTPLHYAAQGGNKVVAELLLDHRAPIDAQDTDGRTALHYAILFNKVETVKLLVDRGASLTLQSNNGNTPLHLAALYNLTNITRFLLNKGASITIENKKDKTPLHMASNLETLKALLFYNHVIPGSWFVTNDKQKMSSLKDTCLHCVNKYFAAGKLTEKDLDKIPHELKQEITKSIRLAYMKHVLSSLGKNGVPPLYREAKSQTVAITAFTDQVFKAKKLDDLKAVGYQE